MGANDGHLRRRCRLPRRARAVRYAGGEDETSHRRSIVRQQRHHTIFNEHETRGPFRRDLLGSRRGCRETGKELRTATLAFYTNAKAPLRLGRQRPGVDSGQWFAHQGDVAALKLQARRHPLDRICGNLSRWLHSGSGRSHARTSRSRSSRHGGANRSTLGGAEPSGGTNEPRELNPSRRLAPRFASLRNGPDFMTETATQVHEILYLCPEHDFFFAALWAGGTRGTVRGGGHARDSALSSTISQ
jgi:hypothetical protein